MSIIISLFILGISLSMDTFSISLSLGTFEITKQKALLFSLLVGIMHFFMPLLGIILGTRIIKLLQINVHMLLGIILLLICIEIIIDILKNEEKNLSLNIFNILILAITVSLDSFSTGLCLDAITNNYLMASIIFSFCSILFTLLGLLIGKYSSEKLGCYANIFGFIMLFILGIYHLFC